MRQQSEPAGHARPADAVNVGQMHFRRLLDKLPAGAYTCDPAGLITYYNPQAVTLWGRAPKLNDPADRFCGSFKLFAADGTPIPRDRCWMALALLGNRAFNGQEIVIERPDGRRVAALANANPIHDDDGRLVGAVNVLVDISERKRLEDTLRLADRHKDEFLATLAHELRNPLAPVRNAVQLLHLKVPLMPELQWALDVIDRQMRLMTRLIDDLLDVARITRNKLELRAERVALAEVLRAAVETSRPLIDACGHEFIVSPPAEPILLNGDPARLAQVVGNLLTNAAKYTDRGGRIWLAAERQGSDAVITVRDSGIGIAAEALPRIFEMFAQGGRSADRSMGGLGIGLALVKRLVELHGGSITAASDGPGRGSEFTVRLPVLVAPTAVVERTPATPAADPPQPGLRILVADDSRDAAASLGMLLRITGNEVRIAYDGQEAATVAGEFRPHVVLMDIGMPKLNGYDAARRIRAQPWGRHMVLVAITGWGQDGDRQRSTEAGFDQHLVKPVEPNALLKLLASIKEAVPDCRPTALAGA